MLAATGACMYIKREVIDAIGLFDEAYPMAYEDVDYCLRAWQAGYRVMYWPAAELVPPRVGHPRHRGRRARARVPAGVLGAAGASSSTPATSRNAEGALRVIYVTEDTGVGGGHRDIFEHLNGLLDTGHEAELWTLGAAPDWFELRAPVRSFEDYEELVDALEPLEAIKVATWWNTAAPVWQASVSHGIPVYFVQDIETSYYPDDELTRRRRARLLPP